MLTMKILGPMMKKTNYIRVFSIISKSDDLKRMATKIITVLTVIIIFLVNCFELPFVSEAYGDSLFDNSSENTNNAGSDSGYNQVSNTGVFDYSYNTNIPPGRNNFQPSLALRYNSGNYQNGILGVGWHFSVGSITMKRKAKNLTADINKPLIVDEYILEKNGTSENLVYVGYVGYTGSMQQYEFKEKYAKTYNKFFLFIGSNDQASGIWKEVCQDGTEISYGSRKSANSNWQYANAPDQNDNKWYCDLITKPYGDYISVDYFRDNHYAYIDRINYCYNKNSKINFGNNIITKLVDPDADSEYQIKFFYENRLDNETIYYLAQSNPVHRKKRLKTLSVSSKNSGLVRAYSFNYDYSAATHRSILSSILERGKNATLTVDDETGVVAGGISKPETTFSMSDPKYTGYVNTTDEKIKNPDFTINTGLKWENPPPINLIGKEKVILRDFNGDGKTDICMTQPNSSRVLLVYLSNGKGFDQPKEWTKDSDGDDWIAHYFIPGSPIRWNPEINFHDYNGDGKTDFCYLSSDHQTLKVRLSNGSGFDAAKPWSSNIQWWVRSDYPFNSHPIYNFSDFNGDGAADLSIVKQIGNEKYRCWARDQNGNSVEAFFPRIYENIKLSNKNGFEAKETTMYPFMDDYKYSGSFGIDFDNDGVSDQYITTNRTTNGGKYDICDCSNEHRNVSLTSTINGDDENYPNEVTSILTSTEKINSNDHTGITDQNGDGYPDFMSYNGTTVRINHRNGYNNCGTGNYTWNKPWNSDLFLTFEDINGDNKADLLYLNKSLNGDSYSLFAYLSTGYKETIFEDTPVQLTDYFTPWFNVHEKIDLMMVGLSDFSGDGLPDLFYMDKTSGEFRVINIYFQSDLLRQIKRSEGSEINVAYVPFEPGKNYPYSEQDKSNLKFVATVVDTISISDGLNAKPSTTSFKYLNAYYDYLTKSFLGFEKVHKTFDDKSFQITGYSCIIREYAGLPQTIANGPYDDSQPHSVVRYRWKTPGRPEWIQEEIYKVPGWGGFGPIKQTDYTYDVNGNVDTSTTYGSGIIGSIVQDNDYYAFGWSGFADIISLKHQKLIQKLANGTEKIERESDYFHYDNGLLRLERFVFEPSSSSWTFSNYGNKNPEKNYSYTETGTLKSLTDEMGHVTTYEYDSLTSSYLSKITDPLTHIVQNTAIDYRFGKPTNTFDENGKETKTTYDPFGRVSRIDYNDQGFVENIYDDTSMPRKITVRTKKDSSSNVKESCEYVDGLGRSVQTVTKNYTKIEGTISTPYYTVMRKVYDSMGRVEKEIGPFLSTSSAFIQDANTLGSQPTTTYFYDGRGRLDHVINPDTSIVSYDYEINNNGVSVITTDADNKKRKEIKNALGQVVEVVEYKEDTPSYHTFYTYNAAGDLVSVKDPKGNMTQMSYDRRGLMEEMKDPDLGHWKYRYDPAGNLKKKEFYTDGGTTPREYVEFTYDAINRVTKVDYPESVNYPSQDTNYTYDKPESAISLNCIGRLFSVTRDGIEIQNNEYDPLGRIKKVTKTIDGQSFVSQLSYDYAGDVTDIVYPDSGNFHIKYEYHPGTSLIRRVYEDGKSISLASFPEYNASEKLKAVTYGNNVETRYEYYPMTLRMKSIKTTKDVATYMDHFYEYFDSGDMKTKQDNVSGSKYTYEYDTLHRLTKELYTPGVNYVATQADVFSFQYPEDKAGATGHHPHVPRYVEYKLNNTTGDRSYSIDYKGNIERVLDLTATTASSRQILYYSDNMPRRISRSGVTLFRYDGNGVRTVKENGTQKTLYIDDNYEIINGVKTRYVFAGNVRVAEITGEAGSLVTRYYHKDHLGSSTLMTDLNGGLVNPAENIDYMAFGLERNSTEQLGAMNYRYTDQEKDKETGLYNYNARLYDPEIGMFVSADTVDPNWMDPQGLNRYAYCRNNPLIYVDPSGNTEENSEQWISFKQFTYDSFFGFSSEISSQFDSFRKMSAGPDFLTSWQTSLLNKGLDESGKLYGKLFGLESHSEDSPGYYFGKGMAIAGGLLMGGEGALSGTTSKSIKSINLPSFRKIKIDMVEVLTGHTSSGSRAMQSGIKDLFPNNMSTKQIEKAIRQAYKHSVKVQNQGSRIKLRGPFGNKGSMIEMWLNTETKIIETAYPKF